jgi:protein-S-isoprenylcysteine O-methyltransferase Ste14
MPPAMAAVSLISGIAFLLFEIELWNNQVPLIWIAAGGALHLAALALFATAVRATHTQRLTLAFDRDAPLFLIARGPYRQIRHPFYASYLIFWVGCVVATLTAPCLLALLVLSAVYVFAARAEEAKFEASSLSADYRDYRRRTGFFWPRVATSSR